MNRSFFGDMRDLFKYDLVRHIMKALPQFASFTFVPMLSDDAAAAAGTKSSAKDLEKAVKAGRAGSQNRDLLTHMARLQEIDSDLEYFQTVHAYFKKENIVAGILHKHPFTDKGRAEYFDDVISGIPEKSLIFLDPDTGLEERKPSRKHLLFEEMKRINDAMDAGSALMVYQHFPRESHDGYVRRRCKKIHEVTGAYPLTITDNEIIFFVLVKNPKLREQMEDVLSRYANSYPVLESGGCHG